MRLVLAKLDMDIRSNQLLKWCWVFASAFIIISIV